MAYVVDDPNILFAIQADGTVNDDDLGANVELEQTASSSTFGISRVSIDISTTATTASLPVRIVDFLGGHDGDERGTSFPIMVCKFNTGHQLGVGVVSGNSTRRRLIMAVMSRANLLKELLPGLNALFGLEYDGYENEHADIYETENSDRSFEEEVKLSGFGAASS